GAVDVLAVGPEERGDGDLDLAAPLELLDRLHAPLAVAAVPHNQGALVVLEAARQHLAGAGAVAVDEADHRAVELAPLRLAAEASLRPLAVLDRDDEPVVDEQVGDRAGRFEVAARVEAHVEDEALHPLLLELLDGLLDVGGRTRVELVEPDVADLLLGVE